MKSKPKRPLTLDERRAWRPWFAWYPIPVNTGHGCAYQWVWLEWIERRKQYPEFSYSSDYLYRLPGVDYDPDNTM